MKFFLSLFIILLFSCQTPEKDPIKKALASTNPKIKTVVDQIDRHEIQILFTEVIRDKDNRASFKDYEFQVDDSLYFYPASTVKFPIAVLALEKINDKKQINRNSKFYVEGDSLESTFSEEIKKIFAISDNQASNRLFEFLGQDQINGRLKARGIDARISHRLSSPNSDALTTKPLVFYLNDSTSTSTEEIISDPLDKLDLKGIKKGLAFKEGDNIIQKAKDFSLKNYLPLRSLHTLIKQLFFPELFEADKRFDLGIDNRKFLIEMMKILPYQAGYSRNEYYDSYGKFFLFGDSKEPLNSDFEIYNKVGYAYGTLTDCAYIINKKNGKEFILTATILVNQNQIFNDDHYEYESIGIPFLAELGRQLLLK